LPGQQENGSERLTNLEMILIFILVETAWGFWQDHFFGESILWS